MIARPKISRNEWKTAEIGAFEVGNFALFSCPVVRLVEDEALEAAQRVAGEARAVLEVVVEAARRRHQNIRRAGPGRAAQRAVVLLDRRAPDDAPVWIPNLQPDFNLRVIERFGPDSFAVLRELDESNRFVQKSAESTSI